MTWRAGRSPAPVAFASPGSQPPSRRHSARIAGPPARWIAPSTPPPPRSDGFAAFTIASTSCSVMSPTTKVTPTLSGRRGRGPQPPRRTAEAGVLRQRDEPVRVAHHQVDAREPGPLVVRLEQLRRLVRLDPAAAQV